MTVVATPLPPGWDAASIEVRGQPAQPSDADAQSLLNDCRAISLRSVARLEGRDLLTDADFYDGDGLPA